MRNQTMKTEGVPETVPEPVFGPTFTKTDDTLEYMSVILNQGSASQALKISTHANTPMWLNKKLYTKLDTELSYDVRPMNRFEL